MPTSSNCMRRVFFVLLLVITLSGCNKSSVPELPPDVVMQKTAEVARNLESAAYTINGNFDFDIDDAINGKGTLRVEGLLQSGGDQVQSLFTLSAKVGDPRSQGMNIDTKFESIATKGGLIYFYLHDLKSTPSGTLFKENLISTFAKKWWILPSDEIQDEKRGGSPVSPVTPDPQIIKEQSQLVRVVRSNGIKKMNNRNTYHYDVELDAEKFVDYLKRSATASNEHFDETKIKQFLSQLGTDGELWIDAETFNVHRIVWKLDFGLFVPIDVSFQMDLRDHNIAPAINFPSDALPFSPIELLDYQELSPPLDPTQEVPSDFEDQILNELIEGLVDTPAANE